MKKKTKQSEESKPFFSNPIYAAIPFQAFAANVEVPKKMPQESEVESLFSKLISDFEFSSAKKQMLLSKPPNEKWDMYSRQTIEDSETPSPEYLLKCLQLRPGPEVLAELAKAIEKKRCSFLQRFIGLNLHQFCLSLLCTFNRRSNPFNPSDIPLNEVVTNSLLVLKCFSHTQFGTTLSAYSEAIPYLVESISSSSSSNLECAVDILNSFLVDNKNIPIVANIKRCIKTLEVQSKSVWSNFSKELARQDKSVINLLSIFTHRMIQIPNDPKVRLRVTIAMEKNGYVNAFKAVKADPSNKIVEPIKQRFASDIFMLKTISPTLMANPFSIKSLSVSIKEIAQPPKLYHSFLISLYDVFINFKMSRINLLVFLHNFLLIYRYFLSKNDKNKLAVAAASAAANEHPIELQFTSAKYKAQDSHKQLFQESYYICNTELASLDLSKFCKIVTPGADASKSESDSQRAAPAENEALSAELEAKLDEKTNEITTLKKKLIAALQENKNLKAAAAQQPAGSSAPQSDEVPQLKSQLEALQAENSNLKNQQSSNATESENLKKQIETLLSENSTLKNEIQQHLDSAKEKEAKKEELSNEIVQLKKKLIAALQEKKTLKTENQQHLTANKEKDDKNTELLNEIDQLKKQVENLLSENTSLKSDSEQQLASLRDKEIKECQINALKSENIQVTNEINQLKEKLAQASSQSEKSQQEVQQLTKQIQEVNEKLAQKANECSELNDQIESLKKSTDSHSNEVSALNEENEKLKNEIAALKSEVSEKVSNADQSSNEINSLKSQIQELTTAKANVTNELNNAKSQLSSKDASIDSIKSQKEGLEKDLDKLRSELKELKNSKENEESARSNLENEISSLKQKLEDANNKIKSTEQSSEEANSTHQNQINALQDQIKSLENSISERDTKIEQLNQTLDSQTKELESASSKEVELNKQISDLLSKGTNDEELQAQLVEKDKLLSNQKNEMDDLRKQVEKLNNDAIAQNSELKSANEKVSTKDQEIIQLKSQTQKDQDQLKTKEQEIESLKNQAQKDQEELKSKEQEIESLKSQTSDSKKEFDQQSTEISNLKSQISNLESQLKKANDEIESKASDLASTKEALEKGSSASQTELLEIKSKCSQLEKELTQAQSEKEEHLNSIKSKDSEIENLISKSEDSSKEIQQLKNQLENSKKEIEQLKSESQNQQQQMQEREVEKDSQREEIDSLKLQLQKITDEYKQTIQQLEKITDDHNATKSQLEKITDEHNTTKSQLEKITDEHNTTKSQLEKITDEHNATKSQLETANNQLNQNSSSSEQQSKEAERLQHDLDEARKEAQEYKDKLEIAQKDTLLIKEQTEEFQKSSKESIAKLESTLLENERLIIEVQSQKDIINQLSLSQEESEKNQAQLKCTNSELQSKLQEFEKQNAELHSEIERKTAENAKLKKDLVDLTPTQNQQLQEQQHRERVRKISDASLSRKLPPKPLLNPPPTKTCLLKWTKLSDDLIKTSFWSTVDESSISFNSDFFSSTTHYIPQYKFASSNNFLVLTKLSPESTIELLRTMNITNESNYDQLFTDDVLDLLEKLIPSEEESQYLATLNEQELTIYEKFMKNLSTIPCLNLRVQFLIIHKRFSQKVEQLKEPFEKISKGLNDLIKSEKLKELLATILKIGNYSNGGNEEFGGAYGFTLDSIAKIGETEIPMFISRNYPDLLQELELLKPIIDNKELKLRKASETIQKYSDELLVCMLEMPNAEIRLKDGDNFWTVFMDFYGANRSSLDSVKELSLDAIKCLNDALLLFGEEENEEFSDFASKFVPLYTELNRGKIISNALDQQFANASKANEEQQQQNEQGQPQFQHETVAAPITQIKDTFKNALGKFFTKK